MIRGLTGKSAKYGEDPDSLLFPLPIPPALRVGVSRSSTDPEGCGGNPPGLRIGGVSATKSMSDPGVRMLGETKGEGVASDPLIQSLAYFCDTSFVVGQSSCPPGLPSWVAGLTSPSKASKASTSTLVNPLTKVPLTQASSSANFLRSSSTS